MKMTMHYQKTRIDKDGRKIFIGEDAHPYSDGKIIIVADGLGGRGGYPHTKIRKDIVNKETFYQNVFAPLFENTPSEDFVNYAVNSFEEIFKTADYYFETDETMRSSGYFASRLVTVITLYLLKYSGLFSAEELFAKTDEVLDLDKKEEIIAEFCSNFARELKAKLQEVSTNLNLVVESSLSGAYLLPSTLTVALPREKEGCLDVIYLWAGDSRGYIWCENGLMQITEDHEEHETMTNLITLSKPFKIEGAYLEGIAKPCILFNASDGCYKCPIFASPFDLEYIFIDAINQSADFNGVSEILKQTFKVIGTHDDSNTMALYTFGWESYEELKQSVKNRLAFISENIIKKLPGILEIDYAHELSVATNELPKALEFCEDLLADESIKNYLIQKMIQTGYAPYREELEKTVENNRNTIRRYLDEYSTIKELALKFTNLPKEEYESWQSISILRPFTEFVAKNWKTGENLSVINSVPFKLRADGELNKPEEVSNELTKFILFIKQGIILFDGRNFIFGEQIHPVSEENRAFVAREVKAIRSAPYKTEFYKFIKNLNDYYVVRYLKDNKANLCDEIYAIPNVDFYKFECKELKNAFSKIEEIKKNLQIRERIYAEYEENYRKLYRGSKL